MDGRFNGGNPEQEEYDTTPENSSESPPLSTSTSSKKRRAMQKTVITLPIKEVERSRLKGDTASVPSSDSWAWRKYGQKPIKGSPYPRGYYRCSSSKGCPARKRVERSSADPGMLVITYSCEHNHPLPLPSRNHHHHRLKAAKTDPQPEPEAELEEKFMDIADDDNRLVMSISADEFTWFGEMDTTSSAVLDCQTFAERSRSDSEDLSSVFFPMREEDESLFADLGELPECSTMFGSHRNLGPEVQIY